MVARKEIRIDDSPEIIRMPLIRRNYFTHDIGLFLSHGDVHIFEKQYREVKCGKGVRKMSDRDESINIPLDILDIFVEALLKFKKQ